MGRTGRSAHSDRGRTYFCEACCAEAAKDGIADESCWSEPAASAECSWRSNHSTIQRFHVPDNIPSFVWVDPGHGPASCIPHAAGFLRRFGFSGGESVARVGGFRWRTEHCFAAGGFSFALLLRVPTWSYGSTRSAISSDKPAATRD